MDNLIMIIMCLLFVITFLGSCVFFIGLLYNECRDICAFAFPISLVLCLVFGNIHYRILNSIDNGQEVIFNNQVYVPVITNMNEIVDAEIKKAIEEKKKEK